MKKIISAFLFAIPLVLLAQAPTAGFEILRAYIPTGNFGTPPFFILEMQGLASGSPSSVTYTAYNQIMQVQGSTSGSANGLATIWLNNSTGGTHYVRQIVSNVAGADTTWDTIPNVDWYNVNPLRFNWINFSTNAGTNFYSIGNNYNTWGADIGITQVGGSFSAFHPQTAGGSATLPGPGQYSVCGTTYWGTGPMAGACDTFNMTCLTTNLNANFSQARVLNTVTFTDLSTHSAPIINWEWDFGDGTTSNLQNPVHTYATPGYYTTCLRVTDQCGQSQRCMYINATCYKPWSQFSETSAGQSFTFNNTSYSQSAVTGTLWQFGDGNTSTATNPSHTYASTGLYNVCLITSNACGSDTSCHTVVVGCPIPTAAFSSSSAQYTATFSTNIPVATAYAWTFGDGGTSTAANPTHTYAATGTYNVCLIASNTCGSDTLCQQVTITCPPPTAAYTSQTSGLSATFTNQGSGSSYVWDFGDGNISTLTNPSHPYAIAGSYTVCLIATNSCGSDTACQTVTVTCTVPNAGFSHTTTQYQATFTNTSTAATGATYAWTFGDGGTSTQASPSHTYAAAGTYNVCLIVTNTCGADTLCQSVTITCPPPVASFSYSTAQLLVTFTNSSTAAAGATYAWTFGDGGNSTQAAPTHTYAGPGTYTICLVVTDLCGADTLCQLMPLTGNAPSSGFGFSINNLTVNFSNTSTESAMTFYWEFGDGATSTLSDPVHTYPEGGTYTACLVATNPFGSDTTCQSLLLTANGQPMPANLLTVYPNPSAGSITATLPELAAGECVLRLTDLRGAQVAEWAFSHPGGHFQQEVDLPVAAGTYLLHISGPGVKGTRKVVRMND